MTDEVKIMFENFKNYNNLYTIKERRSLIMNKIKELRNEHKLQQKEVADFLNINYQTYCNYESGRSEPPAEIIVRLAKLYDVSTDEILQVDNMNKDINAQQEQLQTYRAELANLQKQLEKASPQKQFALKAVIKQIEKLINDIEYQM